MTKVYFKSIESYSETVKISSTAAKLLQTIEEKEQIKLNKFIPLKVHLGEKGNHKREDKMVFIKGRYTLEYAERIGLGRREYTLVEL